jgi:kinesin family member C2/C3
VGRSHHSCLLHVHFAVVIRSLSALGDVLEALDKKLSHVPYRNSKLTYVLQDSLSANSRTLMICAVPPTSVTADETLFTLQVPFPVSLVVHVCF